MQAPRARKPPPKTPVEVLIELGRALHGEHWLGPTARDLDIKQLTLQNWVLGRKRFGEGEVLDALRLLVKSHSQAVARAQELVARGRELSAARPRPSPGRR